jgi:hypothetical protein
MKQTIWIYALCYNESHFVGNFLTAYKDVDRIIVYDNYSTDNSVELLKCDSRVEIRQYDSNNEIRDDIYLKIKNNCWKETRGKVDWVIVVDFDEIFTRMVKSGNEIIYDLDLYEPYKQGFNIIKPYGYNMISFDAPSFTTDHPFKHCQKGIYHPPAEKLCCFRPDQISEINYNAGAHLADPFDMNGSKDGVRIYRNKDYKLLHFKAWNYKLYVERMAMGRNRLSDINKMNGWGYQYLNTDEGNGGQFLSGLHIAKNIFDIEI